MKRRGAGLILAIMAGGYATLCHAQPTPFIIDQHRTDRKPPTAPKKTVPAPRLQGELEVHKFAPFVLRAVRIEGTTVSPHIIAAAIAPFIGHTMNVAALKHLADAVSDAYAKNSNIALYTVAPPQQTFANGVVRLIVAEGYVEHVDIRGDVGGDLDLIKSYAAMLTRERPLTKATLQRYLSLIRDIAGLTPEIRVLQGSTRGAVQIVLTLTQKVAQIGLSVNNQGSALLGRTQLEGDVSFYDIFREGEQFTVTVAAPTNIRGFQYVNLGVSEPLGSEGTLAGMNIGYLHTRPKGSIRGGNAQSLQLVARHPLIRSVEENLSLTADLDGLNSINAVFGQTIANERVRALRVGANYSLASPAHVFSMSGTLSLGLDVLGAHVSNPLLAVPDFQKVTVQAGYDQRLSPQWTARLRAAGQYAGERLPVSELYPLGGGAFGRAYPSATLVGDQGLAGSFELAWRPPFKLEDVLSNTELYGFVDGGGTWLLRRGAVPGRSFDLASTGLGVRFAAIEHTDLQLEGSRQLVAPPTVGANASWEFDFFVKIIQP